MLDMGEPTGPEPMGGPEPMAPEEDMGMGMGGGGLGGDLGGLPEPPSDELEPPEGEGEEEPEVGPFGVEAPEGEEGEEEAPAEDEGGEEELPAFESIDRIANMLTEDPDIFN